MPPETAVLALLVVALTLYAVLGGADFGAGVWEVNTALQAPERERTLLYRAIGPVWEANHVWLIFALVVLQTAFPRASAAVMQALWLPLFLGLLGIVFRGAGFAFRSYAAGAVLQQQIWGVVFALGSTAAPFFLGAAAGAVASGRLAITSDGHFAGSFLTGWISPLSIFAAFFAVGGCAYLAAVYLTREAAQAGDQELAHLWRVRSLATGAWMGVLAFAGVAIVASDAPALWAGFRERGLPFVAVSFVTGCGSLFGLWRGGFGLAVTAAAATVGSVILGLAASQYPVLVPPGLTLDFAKAPDRVLLAVLCAVGGGVVVLVPALFLLFRTFKRRPRQPPGALGTLAVSCLAPGPKSRGRCR
ncbi:MAG TPA: cytochrome d ubiquinol oxidase subunit II [Candidatus Limnocylindria bacterium]|nr:cytochrome d ubiquinol oxidase subunit II [Candidatus Limnocylindria bacterium]